MKQPPVGLQLFTVRDAWLADPAGTLQKLARIGYEEVELFFHELDPAGRVLGLPARELAAMLKSSGLRVAGAHAPWHPHCDWPALIDYNLEIGSPAIGIGAAFYENLADAHRIAAWLNEKCEVCRGSGLEFYYHNHYHEFQQLDGKVVMDVLLDETRDVQFELDVFWITRAGLDPVDFMRRHGARISRLHLKDLDRRATPVNLLANAPAQLTPDIVFGAAPATDFVEIGNGGLDLASILTESLAMPSIRAWIIEQDHCPGDPMTSAEISFAQLQKLAVKLGNLKTT